MPTYQDASVKTCRCKKGHLPLPRLKETALVPGCEETELAKLLTVDSCKRQFTLGAITGTPAQVGVVHKLGDKTDFFDHLPPSIDNFYLTNVDKKLTFLDYLSKHKLLNQTLLMSLL